MKFRKKAVILLAALAVFIAGLTALLGATFGSRHAALRGFYQAYVQTEAFRHITVSDCNGTPIYSGGYSDDETLRCATFHLVGDQYGSVASSVLSQIAGEEAENNLWTGYDATDREVRLTIDLKLQLAAYRTLCNTGTDGCILVIDNATGDIRAMASTPTVDVYSSDKPADEAYLNKALCAYTPGSVFKAVSVAAILESGADTSGFSYQCTGKDGDITCLGVHGKVDLRSAFYESCNCGVAAAMEQYLSAAQLNAYAKKCGITASAQAAGLTAQSGTVDANDHLGWTSDGQSKDLLTPLALGAYYAAIANDGVKKTLRLRSDFVTGGGERIFSADTAAFLRDAMTVGMEKVYGSPIHCASYGKTGTAEVDGQNPHAWFICCLAQEGVPDYTIVTFLKNGGNSIAARKAAATFINGTILGEG